MTQYELMEKCWNIAWDSKGEKGQQFIKLKLGWKEYFYSTLLSWISTYLSGKKFYTEMIDENDKCVPYTNMAEALHDVIKNETDISLTKSTCEEILLEIRNFKMED